MIPKDYQCDGQMNLWDCMSANKPEEKRKPYEYDFNRYVGQKVWVFDDRGNRKEATVKKIEHYYTIVDCYGEELACTSNNLALVGVDYLPTLEKAIENIMNLMPIELKQSTEDGEKFFTMDVNSGKLKIYESRILETNERFFCVNWSEDGGEHSFQCFSVMSVMTAIRWGRKRYENR